MLNFSPQCSCPPEGSPVETSIAKTTRSAYIINAQAVIRPIISKELFNKLDGKPLPSGRPRPAAWPILAEYFTLQKFDAVSYVFAQFQVGEYFDGTLDGLLSPTAERRYREYYFNAVDDLRRAYQLSHGHFQVDVQQWSQNRDRATSAVYVLNDYLFAPKPLFRYCTAVQEGLAKLAEFLHDEALTEYARQKTAYDLAWGPSIIPDKLDEEAAAMLFLPPRVPR